MVVAKIKHALPHADMHKIKQDQDSVMTEESQADSWDWGEACRECCKVVAERFAANTMQLFWLLLVLGRQSGLCSLNFQLVSLVISINDVLEA